MLFLIIHLNNFNATANSYNLNGYWYQLTVTNSIGLSCSFGKYQGRRFYQILGIVTKVILYCIGYPINLVFYILKKVRLVVINYFFTKWNSNL